MNSAKPSGVICLAVAISEPMPRNLPGASPLVSPAVIAFCKSAMTGADITHVPYRSGGALMPDLMGGSVQSAMTEFSTALPLHKGGKARIIGIASAQRSKLAPDIGTFIEGGVKDFTASSYIGILAPAKTPADILAKIEKAIQDGLKPGGTAAERLASIGAELATPEQMTEKGFAAFIKKDAENMQAAAKLAGIKPQ